MHENNPRRARLLVLILVTVVALFAAACGDSETENGSADSGAEGSDSDAAASDAAGDTADTASGEIEGSFLVSGSSTVYPIVLEQAEAFGAANGGVAISVEGPGSGDGAQKFCNGEVPIARFPTSTPTPQLGLTLNRRS